MSAAAGTVRADPAGWFAADDDWPYAQSGPDPVLTAVGDISCQPTAPLDKEKASDVCAGGATATTRNQAQNATGQEVEAIQPNLVAVLGDEQYQNGYYSDFENSYDK